MTNRRTRLTPSPEAHAALKILKHFPGARSPTALPYGMLADFTTPTLIAEIEPLDRWHYGLSQVLEYWALCLRSLTPALILYRRETRHTPAILRRVLTTCHGLPVHVALYDLTTDTWAHGGPDHLPRSHPTGSIADDTPHPWRAPTHLVTAYAGLQPPWRTWHDTYTARRLTLAPDLT